MRTPMYHGPVQQPFPSATSDSRGPSFCLIDRRPPHPGAILLAIVVSVAAVCALVFIRWHLVTPRFAFGDTATSRSPGTAVGKASDDDDDDPSQVDTIALGDPADAPVPARRGDHVSPVHPTILVQLPRFGEKTGLIPDTTAGRLLYAWLAAFNQNSSTMLQTAVPSVEPIPATSAQMELRQQTGGFYLLSAREVQPGVLVFRLRDQTPSATEALGTLQVRPNSNPPQIMTFSLRAVVPAPKDPAAGAPPAHAHL